MNNKDLIFRATSYIPCGRVLTYGQLAQLAGVKSPRAVGSILHQNPDPKNIPCHRVVNSQGRLAKKYAFGGEKAQRKRLEAEEIKWARPGRVDLPQCLWQSHQLLDMFFQLLRKDGEPGLWPWFGTGEPHTPQEIAIGAILTQNVSWQNVETALYNLRQAGANNLRGIYQLGLKRGQKELKELIRPARFYHQKANYLFAFSKFVQENYRGSLRRFFQQPLLGLRQKLLSIYGIGPETADTILLYAGYKPVFVIDAYTKRFAKHHHLSQDLKYNSLQEFFTTSLPTDVRLYQDYHALIVKWGKKGDSNLVNKLTGLQP